MKKNPCKDCIYNDTNCILCHHVLDVIKYIDSQRNENEN